MAVSESEKEALRELVREAGATLLRYWPGGSAAALETAAEEKSDGSLVSRADFASNDVLVSGLQRIFPRDGIHSEEIPVGSQTFERERVWVIDPLDGTAVFLDGRDEFSVLVALTVGGESEFGMMYFPAKGIFLEAALGEGATINGAPLHVSRSKALRPHKVYARQLELTNHELLYPGHLDSGHAFLMAASGELDAAVFRLFKLREWDLAAPAIVVAEAGGTVSDELGQKVSYRPGKLPKVFAASNTACHAELLQVLSVEGGTA